MRNCKVYEVRVYENGEKQWWLNGEYHREDGPAVEWPDGTKEWMLNGNRHREDGPAIENPGGTNYWFLNNELHREDGPAVEDTDGYKAWYLHGEKLTEEEHRLRTSGQTCNGKIVEIDGIKYKLTAV